MAHCTLWLDEYACNLQSSHAVRLSRSSAAPPPKSRSAMMPPTCGAANVIARSLRYRPAKGTVYV
eukprot:2405335-Pleurochrysis_carterae.AAC.1